MGGQQSVPAGAKYSDPQQEQAYAQGREDSTKEIQGALSAVAAQAYDNMHDHLEKLQMDQLDKSQKLAAELGTKLTPYTKVLVADKSICAVEAEALTACLKKGAKDPLVCSAVLNAYSQCAAAAAVKK